MKNVDLFKKKRISALLLSGASVLAFMPVALAQETVNPAMADDEEDTLVQDVIQVTGIRAALASSRDIKRFSEGVVDAISAEDMGKFPDTNLAESLQRLTGVSITRRRGEGSQVRVRGFGPEFNLVLFNGRQMATAYMNGDSIPVSRGFDFANISSDVVAGVDVYKTAYVALPTGGIGSTIDVKTLRPLDVPGMRFIINAKGIADDSITSIGDEAATPELSAFYTNTFNDTVGVMVSASLQERSSGFAQFGVTGNGGFKGFFRGDQSGAATIPQNDPNATNRPSATDIYGIPQSSAYSLNDIETERTNLGLVLQFRPIQNLTATLDYFTSENSVHQRRSDMSVWFLNAGSRVTAWGDGPISDILYYGENLNGSKDLSMGAIQIDSLFESKTLGFNLKFEGNDGFELIVDAHTSTAEASPNGPYGTGGVLSTADFGLTYHSLDFRHDLPALKLEFSGPNIDIGESRMRGTGSRFDVAQIKTSVEEVRIEGIYEFDNSLFKSISFGVGTNNSDYRGSYRNHVLNRWGGVGNTTDYPDDIWRRTNLANNFDQFNGHENTRQEFFVIDFQKLLATMDKQIGNFQPVCGGDGNCVNDARVASDYITSEETLSAYFKVDADYIANDVSIQASAGLRLERTTIESSSLIGTPTGTAWVADNEFTLTGLSGNRQFFKDSGIYEYALPAINIKIVPNDTMVLRGSWGKSMTRPSFEDIKGGGAVNSLFRVTGGTGSFGDPDLKPYISKNSDISGEWYYDDASYIAISYFAKKVDNFIGTNIAKDQTPFEIYTPYLGRRYLDAQAALNGTTDLTAIRFWIFQNRPAQTRIDQRITDSNGVVTGYVGEIYGIPGEDPLVTFDISTPVNLRTNNVDGWEFAWQHFFGDSGFGIQANYTIVGGDGVFNNNLLDSDRTQTPIIGLADSYNLIGFYEKDSIQVRVAYNWTDSVLEGLPYGGNRNAQYKQEYGQFDFSSSFKLTDEFTVIFEGVNVTNETEKSFIRSPGYPTFLTQTGPRYFVGVRYTF